MTELHCSCRLTLPGHADYMPAIHDRLESFRATVEDRRPGLLRLSWPFGWAAIATSGAQVELTGGAEDTQGLARIKDLLATAFRLYAKADDPRIRWQGDGAGDTTLAPFRLMEVEANSALGPHMRRVRLRGEDLARFDDIGTMHVRLLLPTEAVPDPVWPIAGPDGLSLWPDPDRKPVSRVYTIRAMDAAAGWVDIDLVTHGTEGPGSAWALTARPGERVGMFGPLGRPVNRAAAHYIMAADETGLPALARMLETLPEAATGIAWIEVADEGDIQPIANRTGIAVEWVRRGPETLADRVIARGWPEGVDCFGWFAAEDAAARQVRTFWRGTLGLDRRATLAAAYWKRGAAGLMAG